MKITLPSHIYNENLGDGNNIFQEIISIEDIDCDGIIISKNGFIGYEFTRYDNGEKILVIAKKAFSKIVNDYAKILMIKKGDLRDDNFKSNINIHINGLNTL